MLELKNVDTVYDKIPVLDKVNLQISQGEAVCLLGANGAGKTTLLKTILGIVKPVGGNVYFLGDQINTLPPHEIVKKGIAIVPEREGLFPDLPVEINIDLGAYFEKNKNLIEERKEQVYHLFPRLKERKRQRAGTLSGGEQRMLYIGRALMSEPKMILLDEPSLGLAPAMVNEVYNAIAQIKRDKGNTILLVEQNAGKALSIADRGYIIQKGQVVFQGTVSELKESGALEQSYLGHC